MTRIIKTSITLLSILLLSWALPTIYKFICSTPYESPLTLYSCVIHDFVTFTFGNDDNVAGVDMHGTSYSDHQFDSIMPTIFFNRLAKEGRLPDRIDDKQFDLKTVERSNFVFRSKPSDLNKPHIPLHMLMESMPKDGILRMPSDVFRITDQGLEFVEMSGNCIDREKSTRFTHALQKRGFIFPAQAVAVNASTHKAYDNGCLLIDKEGQAFHMKQIQGRPYIRRIIHADTISFKHAFLTEFPDRRLLGFLVDNQGNLFATESSDLSIHQLPLSTFNPTQDRIVIAGDMFYWTIIRERNDGEHLSAIRAADYKLVGTQELEFPQAKWKQIRKWIFPFRLEFISLADKYLKPRLVDSSWQAIWFNILLAIGYWLRLNRKDTTTLIHIVGIMLLGLFAFIPLIVQYGGKRTQET